MSSKRNIHGLTLTLDAKGFSSRPRTRMNGGPWPNTVAIDLGQTPRPPTVHSRPFAWLRQVLAKMLQQIGWTTVATETLLVKQARSLSRRLPTRPSVACFASLFHLFPPPKKRNRKSSLGCAHDFDFDFDTSGCGSKQVKTRRSQTTDIVDLLRRPFCSSHRSSTVDPLP